MGQDVGSGAEIKKNANDFTIFYVGLYMYVGMLIEILSFFTRLSTKNNLIVKV